MMHLQSLIPAGVASAWASFSQKAQEHTPAFMAATVSGLWSVAIAAPRYTVSLFTNKVAAPSSLGVTAVSLIAWAALLYKSASSYVANQRKEARTAEEALAVCTDLSDQYASTIRTAREAFLRQGNLAPSVTDEYALGLATRLENTANGADSTMKEFIRLQWCLPSTQKAEGEKYLSSLVQALEEARALANQLRNAVEERGAAGVAFEDELGVAREGP